MKFKTSLTEATLLKRYFRFLVEVAVPNHHRHRLIHCPNLGPLLGCDILGSRIWYASANKFSNQILDTWELVEIDEGHLVAVNPEHSKTVVVEAVNRGIIKELQGFYFFKKTVFFGHNNTIHVLISAHGEQAFLSIEPVTFGNLRGDGYFPDSLIKDTKHLYELMAIRQAGYRAILLFCVQNVQIQNVRPADAIHPEYGHLLREASSLGVEILAYRSRVSLGGIELLDKIPVVLSEKLIS